MNIKLGNLEVCMSKEGNLGLGWRGYEYEDWLGTERHGPTQDRSFQCAFFTTNNIGECALVFFLGINLQAHHSGHSGIF